MLEVLEAPTITPPKPPPSAKSNRGTVGRSQLSLMLDAQAIIIQRLDDFDGTDKDLAALACAAERLSNRIERLRGRPEPKPIDVTAKPKRQRPRGPEDSTDPSA